MIQPLRTGKAILCFWLVLNGFIPFLFAQSMEQDSLELRRLVEAYTASIPLNTAGEYFDQIASPAYFFTFANGKINERAEHQRVMGSSTNTYHPIELSEWRIELLGQTGVVSTLRVISGTRKDGTPFSFRHRYTDVYAKVDGKWVLMNQTQSVVE